MAACRPGDAQIFPYLCQHGVQDTLLNLTLISFHLACGKKICLFVYSMMNSRCFCWHIRVHMSWFIDILLRCICTAICRSLKWAPTKQFVREYAAASVSVYVRVKSSKSQAGCSCVQLNASQWAGIQIRLTEHDIFLVEDRCLLYSLPDICLLFWWQIYTNSFAFFPPGIQIVHSHSKKFF